VAGVQGAGAQMAAALLGTIGETAVQIGKMMVLAGLAEEAIKRFAGATAVGFGLALIALGSIVKGVASRMGNLGGGMAAGGGAAAAPSRSGAEYYFGSQGSGATGPRYYFIESGGAVREGSRSEAVQYLERTTQGQTRRDLQRLVRTDELVLNR
jgi:hypothetical protein